MIIISVIFKSGFVIALLSISNVFADTMHQDYKMKGSDVMVNEDLSFAGRKHAVTQTSMNGLYTLSLFSNQSPVPLQKIHSWTLHVETSDGKPVENLKIYVNGGMPMHRHGFPTKPRVSEHLGNGDYRVDGIKFNMVGHWEMRFNITDKNKPVGSGNKDRVVFKIPLK